jgi:hypothetical protein
MFTYITRKFGHNLGISDQTKNEAKLKVARISKDEKKIT